MVAASSDSVCVSVDDVPAELLAKEREVAMGMEDIASKPEVRGCLGAAGGAWERQGMPGSGRRIQAPATCWRCRVVSGGVGCSAGM